MQHKNALIVGIRDEDSICYSIACELKRAGYTIYATYQDESTVESVSRVAEDLGFKKIFPYDASKDEDIASLATALQAENVYIDKLVHGISYSTHKGTKFDMPLTDVTWEEFTEAIRVSAFSLVELTGNLLPVLNENASVLTISARWSRVAVANFNIVCAAKAALESIIRGLADSLGQAKAIRVNGISPGHVPTYTLGTIGNRLDILEQAKAASPLLANVRKEDIASMAVSVLENSSVTGMVYPVDAGVGIMG